MSFGDALRATARQASIYGAIFAALWVGGFYLFDGRINVLRSIVMILPIAGLYWLLLAAFHRAADSVHPDLREDKKE
ncbi:MAG: hypothetical protein ACXIU7_07320 [Roseinatronobacter sp.]